MRLLIVTQAVDTENPVLGFFVRWVEELAKRVERVEVICLSEGKHTLPDNVRVHSLGKPCFAEATQGKERRAAGGMIYHTFHRTVYAWRFLRLAWKLRRDYDAVFVHMNPEYLVIAGWLWRFLRKPSVLWYVHRAVNPRLRLAHMFANAIATSAPESYGIQSSKVHYVGHGIDIAQFSPTYADFHTPVRIVSAGRITRIKNLDTLVEAVALLRADGFAAEATLFGAPVTATDNDYRDMLVRTARERGIEDAIHFAGSIPHDQLPVHLRNADIAVNLAPTGGMDKAVLEAMAAGLLVFASNLAFKEVFAEDASDLMFRERDARDCADKIGRFLREAGTVRPVRERLVQQAATMSVEQVAGKILNLYEASR